MPRSGSGQIATINQKDKGSAAGTGAGSAGRPPKRQGGLRMASQGTSGKQGTASQELGYVSGGLRRETGWWGAFVIGLAGTILVTGIAPVMVSSLGASSVPITVFITLTG